jgi:membrane associated rhomboid family serine protease
MIDELITSINLIIKQTQNNLTVLAIIIAIPWMFFFVSHFISNRVLYLGIIPRHLRGLVGVIFAPVLHANFNHLFFNSIPLLVLSNFILIDGLSYYLYVTLLITLISGFAIWCFAKPGIHIGASALITGYWSFLICNLYQNPSFTTIILGLLSVYYFAGIFLGIFPSKKGLSWEGHLFGLLAGIATCYVLKNYPMQNLF